jgi:hypothetical protein
MKAVTKMLWLATGMIAMLTAPAVAHHSHGNYDVNNYIELQGQVSELLWLNPHTWIYLEVEDDNGEPVVWALEGGSPGALTRDGWRPDSVQAGDIIKVRCHQLRDGSNGCLLGFVTPPGGEEKEWD